MNEQLIEALRSAVAHLDDVETLLRREGYPRTAAACAHEAAKCQLAINAAMEADNVAS